jgi:hypothetical protein
MAAATFPHALYSRPFGRPAPQEIFDCLAAMDGGTIRDMVAMVAHAEGVGDELRHSPRRPDVAAVSIRFSASRQEKRQLSALLCAQSRCHPGRWPPLQPFYSAMLASALEPLTHRSFTDAQHGSEVLLRPALVFFRLQRPPVFGWLAVETRVALTYAAIWVIALAAWQAGRPDLIRSPRLVLAHVWEGLEA